VSQPRNADPVPYIEEEAPLTDLIDDANNFMTWDYRQVLGGEIAFGEVEISATDAAHAHVNPNLPTSRSRHASIDPKEWFGVDRAGPVNDPGLHGLSWHCHPSLIIEQS
jgi:hypothetical protein